ncbi:MULTISPECIES: response regulator [unclassified Yoonia]|uniref:response regulator n=1 Tax=unclassified Yoonia TaxID=2629118 RepID=UPI002AFF5FFC|nr:MULTISPECIES: response regulator [unclassified Yoonia]
MQVLIVQADAGLGALWQEHLERLGAQVQRVGSGAGALGALEKTTYDVIVLDVMLDGGSALAIADLAQVRHPRTNIVFVTDTTIFSDGSIFGYSANARAFIQTATPPKDLAAIVHHYGSVTADRAGLTDR